MTTTTRTVLSPLFPLEKKVNNNGTPYQNQYRQQHPKKKIRKKYLSFIEKERKRINRRLGCIVFFKQTSNNTFITVKNRRNKVLTVRSCGSVGFKGPKRGGYYAAVALAKEVANGLRRMSKKYIRVVLLSKLTKSIKLAVKNISCRGARILQVVERIPLCHNGLRPSKVRRL